MVKKKYQIVMTATVSVSFFISANAGCYIYGKDRQHKVFCQILLREAKCEAQKRKHQTSFLYLLA